MAICSKVFSKKPDLQIAIFFVCHLSFLLLVLSVFGY